MAHWFSRGEFQSRKNFLGSTSLQVSGQLDSDIDAASRITGQLVADDPGSVLTGDKPAKPKKLPVYLGKAAQRNLAASSQCPAHSALSFNAASSGYMMQRLHELHEILSVCEAFYA